MSCDAFASIGGVLSRFWLAFVVLGLLASSQVASAQVAASISGRVEDPSAAPIAGAAVTVTSIETGAMRNVTTDAGGSYQVLSLQVGRYEVKAEKQGFKAELQTGIDLVVGQQAVVNLTMELGTVAQTVTVTGEAPIVNTTTESVSGLVGEQQVKDLPLNGRSFDNLITLNPGSINMNEVSGGGSTGNWFTVDGRRMEQNLYLLNGIEITGAGLQVMAPDSASGQMLGIDGIREFNVLTDSYSAAYGKRPGAQINIVTQSGTNQLHGTVFEFLRNSALDSRNYFDQGAIPGFKRNQFGGALGGPIRKDKTFIFGNYEGFRQLLNESGVAIVPDLNARQGLLPNAQGVPTPVTGLSQAMLKYMVLWPEPNGPELGGGFAESFGHPLQTIQQDYGTTRLDQIFSTKDSASVNYTIDNGLRTTPAADFLYNTITDDRTQTLSVQELHIFSPETLNTARFGFSRAYVVNNAYPLIDVPPSLEFIAGVNVGGLSIGGSSGGNGSAGGGSITPIGSINVNEFYVRNLFTYTDDVQHTQGKHQISFGVWFQRLQENRHGATQAGGSAAFTSLTTFLQGTVNNFTGNPTSTEIGNRLFMGAWYVSDKIALTRNLTLSIGLRHEFNNSWTAVGGRLANYIPGPNGLIETTPLIGRLFTQNNAKWQFNPRGALAWDVFGNGKTAIRAAGGIYHQIQDELGYVPDVVPPFNGRVTLGQNAYFPAIVPAPSGVQPPPCGPGVPSPCTIYAPYGVQPNMKVPTVDQWNLTIQQGITPNTAIQVAYVGSHAVHQLIGEDLNSIAPLICSNPAGCVSGGINKATGLVAEGAQYIPVGTRPNPYLGSGYFWQSDGNSSYNALQVSANHRFSYGLLFRANYTWAKSLDSGSSFYAGAANNSGQTVMDPYDVARDWGLSNLDIAQQGSFSGSYELPFGHGKPWLSGVSGVADKVVSGWQINSIVTLLTGFPVTPLVGSDNSGNGDSKNPDRPSVNPAFTGPVVEGRQEQWYNPQAFLLPTPGTWGNLGRGTVRGPGLEELDLSLFKTTSVTERLKAEFRAEFFNILNNVNFSYPNETVFSGAAYSPSAGLITATSTTSRQIQFGLKLMF